MTDRGQSTPRSGGVRSGDPASGVDTDSRERLHRAASFGDGGADYERIRPGYPHALVDDVLREAGGRLRGRVLDVGAGTGRATIPLARTGAHVEALDPSADMLRVLGERAVEAGVAGRITLRRGVFEDIDTSGVYDVVVAAQSFHWTDPATRWQRLARIIVPDGRAFLYWNHWGLSRERHDAHAIRELHSRKAPGIRPDLLSDAVVSTDVGIEQDIAGSGLELLGTRTYRWTKEMPIDDYACLLRSTSQYKVADADLVTVLFDGFRQILGSRVVLDGGATMFILGR